MTLLSMIVIVMVISVVRLRGNSWHPAKLIRDGINSLGIKRQAHFVRKAFVKAATTLKPLRIVNRRGITYSLDLTEMIDFAIYFGGWEIDTINFLTNYLRAGDTVIEVGANIGAHALIIADLIKGNGRLFAFEPTKYARDKLNRNIDLNPHLSDQIMVMDNVVTNNRHDMPKDMKTSWRIDGRPHMHEATSTGSITVDGFAKDNVRSLSLLKIDVDGYDVKVLQGAENTIRMLKPIILIEVCDYTLRRQGDTVRDLFRILVDEHRYYPAYLSGHGIGDIESFIRTLGQHGETNLVFRPQLRMPVGFRS